MIVNMKFSVPCLLVYHHEDCGQSVVDVGRVDHIESPNSVYCAVSELDFGLSAQLVEGGTVADG